MTDGSALVPNEPVEHHQHGRGRVVANLGATVVVRFGNELHQLPIEALDVVPSLDRSLRQGRCGDPTEVLLRAQGLAISSVNDQWGVFSRSRIQLLPHQLWVCRVVNAQWPFRWLIADDVGLGKTIEAGLILMPLIASARVRRLLILTPASLVAQWQYRLRDMFDIRLQSYVSQADTDRSDYWGTASMVVASFHTLRNEQRGARQRLLEADPWDLVIVDEAHHLNADERMGDTLAYGLLAELNKRKKTESLLFFTGTPHRGKDYGFFKLMQLIRPDLFNPERKSVFLFPQLRQAMIRNNKASATDLRGEKLFTSTTVHDREYEYSDEEDAFYRTLSQFILDGRAYATSATGRAKTARMLVLTTLQKLAASSIASVRKALFNRRRMLQEAVRSDRPKGAHMASEDLSTLDDFARWEEQAAEEVAFVLMKDEIRRLDELLNLSNKVGRETKIDCLVKLVRHDIPDGESVLLFTEYKATQALVMNSLQRECGFGTVTFINGDDRLDGVEVSDGPPRTIRRSREDAADSFNAGKVRFLVSTEAGGEGIDLQENCCTLIHMDMPWNPMRMHQRVGRLSRYGQMRPVTVFILRNPGTVEARIWELLNAKLERIQVAHTSVMDDREDILQLVTGAALHSSFDRLFSDAQEVPRERLAEWFDQETATLGGQDVVDTARELLGNVARFDFQQVGKDLPMVDLPDLESFFVRAVGRHRTRVFRRDGGLAFNSPNRWKARSYAVRDRYEGLVFDRTVRGKGAATKVLGVGHTVFDIALQEAGSLRECIAMVSGLRSSILVVSAEDEITGTGAVSHRLVFGVSEVEGNTVVLRDWELLQRLNSCRPTKEPENRELPIGPADVVDRLMSAFQADVKKYTPMLQRPTVAAELLLVPDPAG